MTVPAASKSRVAYIAEVVAGTTPATPTFLEMRRAGGAGMRLNKATAVSDEIHLARDVIAEMQLSQDPTAAYDFELSYGSFDDMLAAALYGSWTTNVLKNGNVEQTFTLEETVDLGGGASFDYNRMVGAVVDQLSLNFERRQIVKGSVSMMGRSLSLAAAIIAGATYTAPNTNVIETANLLASASFLSLASPRIQSISLNIANNTRRITEVGSLTATDFGLGQIDVTGQVVLYYSSSTPYSNVLSHATGALSFNIGTVTNKKYTFSLPTVQVLDGIRQIGGKNDDVMLSIPFRAIKDVGIGASIQITRAVA